MNLLGKAVYTTYVVLWAFSDSSSMLAIPLNFTFRFCAFRKAGRWPRKSRNV